MTEELISEGDVPLTLAEQWPELVELFWDFVWPLALDLGVRSEADTLETVTNDFLRRLDSNHKVAEWPTHPKQIAALEFGQACVSLRNLEKIDAGDHSLTPDEVRKVRRVAVSAGSYCIPLVCGYMLAMDDSKKEAVRRGANGRRLIGATKRERLRRAAEPFMGRMSRFQAAPLIADKIGAQPSSVLKLLSKLYPGDTWAIPVNCDTSDD